MTEQRDVDRVDRERDDLVDDRGEHNREDQRLDREDGLLDHRGVVDQAGRRPRDPFGDRDPREQPRHQELGKARKTGFDRDPQHEGKDRRVKDHPEDRKGDCPEDPEARARIPGPNVANHHLPEQKGFGGEYSILCGHLLRSPIIGAGTMF